MTKTEFIDVVAEKAGVTKKDAKAVIEAYHSTVTEALRRDEKIQLVGFGTYEARQRAAREGRNPQTGKAIKIAASRVPALKFSSAVRNELN